MRPDLQPEDPLSQVVFVHDYLQLVFQDCTYTLWNAVTYSGQTGFVQQGSAGFCDAVVNLIGQTAEITAGDTALAFRFSAGDSLVVPVSDQDARGPEAWALHRLGGTTVVEQNA